MSWDVYFEEGDKEIGCEEAALGESLTIRLGDVGLAVGTTELERTGHCHALPRRVTDNSVEATTVREGAVSGTPELHSNPEVHTDVTAFPLPSAE
jgi:hypothetical protein